jgi:hypothetical protein
MSYWEDVEADYIAGSMLYEQQQEQRAAMKAHQNFRNNTWRTKDNRELAIKDMEDSHLLNAYKQSGRGDLFKEMVVRLFEARVKGSGT